MPNKNPFVSPNRRGGVIGSFPSSKTGHIIRYSSSIERDILFLLEFDTDVHSYVAQPFTIESLQPDGKPHKYTPDYFVTHRRRNQLIECKPAAKVLDSHTQQQIAIGKEWAAEHNCDFKLVTDAELNTGCRLANLKILYRYKDYPVPYDQLNAVLIFLKSYPEGVDVNTISKHLVNQTKVSKPSECFSKLCYLLFRHILHTDLSVPLGLDSTIYLTREED